MLQITGNKKMSKIGKNTNIIQGESNTFTASIFLVYHLFSKVDREFNSMNIQRRNVSSERILILFFNTTHLFSVAVSKETFHKPFCVIKFREKLIFHKES
jgi:hypothetical protein